MKRIKKISMLFFFLTGLILCPSINYSQRLYDKARDEQAQKALELAEPLKNASIFEKMLQNLASRTKLDFETEFLAKNFDINARSMAMFTWKDAHQYVCEIQLENKNMTQFPDAQDIQNETAEVKKKIESSKKSLAEFECAIKNGTFSEKVDAATGKKTYECKKPEESDSALTSLFDRLGDLKSVIEFSEKLSELLPENSVNPQAIETLKKVEETIETLQGVYDAYTAKVKEYNDLKAKLGEMRIVLKQVALQSLQVDEQHLKNVAAIQVRMGTEQGEIFGLINRYKLYVRSLELADLDQKKTNGSPYDFCDAAVKEDPRFAYKNSWMIVEHLKEIIQHSKRLEKDNQNIQSKAKLTLLKLNKKDFAGADSLIPDVIKAIEDAKKNIDNAEILHLRERQLSCPDTLEDSPCRKTDIYLSKYSEALKNAATADAKITALQEIINFSYKSTIKNRDMAALIPRAIYDLAAFISHGDTPRKLAEIRMATELQAYSIRKSAVRARAYELAVSTGAQRLSLFYKGGIKPETIAELVFAISNVAIPPAILAK